MHTMKDPNREKVLAEVERIRRHLRDIGRKTFRGVHVFADNRDELRVYYRRDQNAKSIPIAAHPIKQPAEFYAEYMAARHGGPNGGGEPFQGTRHNQGSHEAGTHNAALDVLVGSSDYASKKPNTKKAYNYSIETVRIAFGGKKLSDMKPYHWEQLVDETVAKHKDVANLITVLRHIYNIGHKRGWTRLDLMAGVHLPKKNAGAVEKEAYRPWLDVEIEAWRRCYPIGSMPRLCFELALNQALGRSEVIRLAPCDITTDAKGVMHLELHRRKRGSSVQRSAITDPDLLACLAALPPPAADEPVDIQGRSLVPFLRQVRGAPYCKANTDHAMQAGASCLGVDWQRWRAKVGLPVDFKLHSGRSTFAVEAADNDIDERGSMAAMGHTGTSRIHRKYAMRRDQRRAGANASAQVAEARQQRRTDNAGKVVAIRGGRA